MVKVCALGQWLWLSWYSGRFRHHRSAVRNQSLANFFNLFTINYRNKEKEAGNGLLKKSLCTCKTADELIRFRISSF